MHLANTIMARIPRAQQATNLRFELQHAIATAYIGDIPTLDLPSTMSLKSNPLQESLLIVEVRAAASWITSATERLDMIETWGLHDLHYQWSAGYWMNSKILDEEERLLGAIG